jgi:hypothetical protein
MKNTLFGSAMLLATTIGLLSSLRQQAVGCFPVGQRGLSGSWTPIEINTETALIVWDAEHKVEHFIRKATFQTNANHFGFLVPTPTKPELAEAKDAIFSKLSSITAPPIRLRAPASAMGGAGVSYAPAARPTVTLLESKQVAGFEAAILAANDAKALNEWLQKNGYESGRKLDAWLKLYIDQGWIITAFKIAKSQPRLSTVGSTAVRMSFRTDRPFFPYREPSAQVDEPLVADDVIARQPAELQSILHKLIGRVNELQRRVDSLTPHPFRMLTVYFLADRAFEGRLGDSGVWNGRTTYSNQLSNEHRNELLDLIKIESLRPPANLWLTEFADYSVVREGDRDLFFSAAPPGTPPVLKRPVSVFRRVAVKSSSVPPSALQILQERALAQLSMAAQEAWLGRDKEYAETCARALELGKGSNDPLTLERVAKASLLRANGDGERVSAALVLARKADELGSAHPSSPWFHMALGMAEFRSGHSAQADAALIAAMKTEKPDSPIWLTSAFYRAMNLFRKGQRDEAHKLATEAVSKIKPLPNEQEKSFNHDDLIVWMAYKEAKELLNLERASAALGQPVEK